MAKSNPRRNPIDQDAIDQLNDLHDRLSDVLEDLDPQDDDEELDEEE